MPIQIDAEATCYGVDYVERYGFGEDAREGGILVWLDFGGKDASYRLVLPLEDARFLHAHLTTILEALEDE